MLSMSDMEQAGLVSVCVTCSQHVISTWMIRLFARWSARTGVDKYYLGAQSPRCFQPIDDANDGLVGAWVFDNKHQTPASRLWAILRGQLPYHQASSTNSISAAKMLFADGKCEYQNRWTVRSECELPAFRLWMQYANANCNCRQYVRMISAT